MSNAPETAAPLRPPKKRSMSRLVGHLVGGNVAAMGIRLVSGVLLGRLVPPATLGLFNGIGLSLRYAPFLQLGILDGLYRELPYYIGRGDRKRAEELASAAQAWALTVGIAYAAVLVVIGLWHLARSEFWMAAGWLTNAVQAIVFYYKTYYLQVTYRTSQDFSRLAFVGVVESVASLVLLLAVAWLNYYGLCVRALLVSAVSTGLLFYWRPLRVAPKWGYAHMKYLLRIGLPIFSVGQLYSFWAVLNSTLVLKFAGVEGMGLYTMVLMADTSLEIIPTAVSQVVYPRMAEHYGRTHRVEDMIRIAWKPMILTALGLIPVIAIAWHVIDPAVRLVIPAYEKAIPAMQWIIFLPLIKSFYPLASIYQVVRRQDIYGAALAVGLATYVAAQVWLLRDGVELVDFPQAMIIGRVVFTLACAVGVAYLLRKERASAQADAPAKT